MKKPHEQEWHVSKGVVMGGLRPVCDEDGTPQCAVIREEVELLIAAAPDMARALLAFVESARDSGIRFTAPGPLTDAYAALRKAGVIR